MALLVAASLANSPCVRSKQLHDGMSRPHDGGHQIAGFQCFAEGLKTPTRAGVLNGITVWGRESCECRRALALRRRQGGGGLIWV